MSKKWIKNLVAGAVCVAVLGTTFGMDYMMVSADTTDDEELVQETEVSFDVTDANSSFPIKEETVFISTDASGETNHIQVSEWLKNEDKSEVLKDATNLLDIENVNGEELFMLSGRDLDIQANGSDIYYRGELDASTELPISLEVTYKLDGVEISPADLEGKSGHLEMTIKYHNNTSTTIEEDGELYDVCVPFTVTSVMMLPSENVCNISIENGKVIETGSLAMVLGFGFPGINESFGVEDGVFTDTVVLEAEVEDYSVETIMTYCSNDVFREADLEDAVSMESVTNSLEEITNSSVDGLQEINSFDDLVDELDAKKEDLNRMNDGAGELKDGAKELSNGAVSLKNNMILFDTNMSDVALGAVELAEGAAYAYSGSQDLANGAAQVSNGANALNAGIQSMYSGIEDSIMIINMAIDINKGTTTVYDQLCAAEAAGIITTEQAAQKAVIEAGLTEVYSQIGVDITIAKAGIDPVIQAVLSSQVGVLNSLKVEMDQAGLTDKVAKLASGASEVTSGTEGLRNGLASLSGGASDLSAGLQELSSASGQLADGTVDLASGSVKLVDGTSEMKDGTQELANLFEGDTGVFVNTGKALQEAAENYTTFTSLREGQEGSVSFVIKSE